MAFNYVIYINNSYDIIMAIVNVLFNHYFWALQYGDTHSGEGSFWCVVEWEWWMQIMNTLYRPSTIWEWIQEINKACLILKYVSQDTEDHDCNFCGVQKFPLVGEDVKYLFYI